MRRIVFAFLLIFLLINVHAMAKPMNVISVGIDREGNEAAAIDKMCLNAAGHSLAFILPPSQDPASDFVRLVKSHYREVTSSPTVKNRKNDGSVMVVVGEVTVDYDRLRDIVRSEIKGRQDEETDAVACFLVRVTGIEKLEHLARAYGDVLQTYGAVFEGLGFRVKAGDEVTREVMKNPPGESFADYCRRVHLAALDDPEVTYAVIGEIALEKIAENEAGVMWASTARLQARDFTQAGGETVIFQFDDDYKLKGRDNLISLFALRKAAMNSSRALAEHTLAYWKAAHHR